MYAVTNSQIRKMYVLSKERGIDNEILHAHIYRETGKDSITKLTIAEANKVIDSLTDKETDERRYAQRGEKYVKMATNKQMNYIFGLLVEMGWANMEGKPDKERFRAFIKSRFKTEHERFLTCNAASKVIEALKDMIKRGEKAEVI